MSSSFSCCLESVDLYDGYGYGCGCVLTLTSLILQTFMKVLYSLFPRLKIKLMPHSVLLFRIQLYAITRLLKACIAYNIYD
jgi:hypothetical protein